MITIKHGSIFDSRAQVLGCPVNCVGVMGKGLALEFRMRYREQAKLYTHYCKIGDFKPGHVLNIAPVLFVSTKDDWRFPSRIEWIEQALTTIRICNYRSIALPQLGCGCGGLDWAEVWPLYEKHLGGLDCDVEVWIYESH